jgi:pimeloyl-ACP methyl ester carboxylesterase
MYRSDPDALLGGSVARLVGPPSLRGYFGQLYAISGWTSLPWVRTLRQPTLVLAGDDDPIVPLVNGRILACRMPQARLHVIHGGGHLFILERRPRGPNWSPSSSFRRPGLNAGHANRAVPAGRLWPR